MHKVYLKGFERPYSIIGDYLFEDERFYVVANQGLQSKIPWSNVLYIEVIEAVAQPEVHQVVVQEGPQPRDVFPASPVLKSAVDRAMAQSDGAIEAPINLDGPTKRANVVFTGFKQQTFQVDIPVELMEQSLSTQMLKVIFENPNVKATLGDFILAGPLKIEGDNIFIPTAPLQNKAEALKDKLEVTSKFLSKIMASSAVPPSLNLDAGFGLVGSPFKTMVPLQDNYDPEEI